MIIRLLFLICSLSFGTAIHTKAIPSLNIEAIEPEFSGITISISDNVLHVSAANGQTLQVYNVAGICVLNFKVEGADKRYELSLPKGFYIVKVGKVVRKIALK